MQAATRAQRTQRHTVVTVSASGKNILMLGESAWRSYCGTKKTCDLNALFNMDFGVTIMFQRSPTDANGGLRQFQRTLHEHCMGHVIFAN